MSNLVTIQNEINAYRPEFESVLTDRAVNFAKEAEFAMQSFEANPYLATVAINNKASFRNAIINLATIGITLNPAQKLAYLVPRKQGKDKPAIVCLDIGYMGLLHIAIDTGAIMWGQAKLVCANDRFELVGIDKEPIHIYPPFGDRGAVVGAYCVVKTASGDYLTEAMSVEEINAIRDTSESWKNPEKRKYSPWEKYWGEMAKKTVIKRAYKLWPKTDKNARLESAIHMLNTVNDEGITDAKHSNVDTTPIIEHILTINSLETLNAYWKSISGLLDANTPERQEVIDACAHIKSKLLAQEKNTVDIQAQEVTQ